MDKTSARDSTSLMSRAIAWPVRTFKRFSADRSAPMAASIAFYSAFSLAPTLVMVIAVAGLVFGEEAARGQIFHQVSGMLGKDAAASVQTIVEHAHRSGGGGIAAVISFVLLAVGASATFSSLNTALSVVWPAEDKEKSGVATLVKVRLISFGLVMGVAFLLIISLVLDTAVQAAGKWVFGESPLVVIGDIAQFLLGLVILSCAFAALMKYLPDGHVAWRDAFVGGVIAAVLFSVGKKLFALYLTHAGTANAFGAAGSLAVLMMWLYFAAAVLLLGAEAAAARAEAREGKPTKESSAADQPGAPAMPAPGTGASNNGSHDGVHGAPHAPVLASAAHAQPVAPAPLPPVPPVPPVSSVARSTSGSTRSSPWSNAVAKGVHTVKANPMRLAIAAAGAGASLFVFAKGSSRTPGRHHRSVKV